MGRRIKATPRDAVGNQLKMVFSRLVNILKCLSFCHKINDETLQYSLRNRFAFTFDYYDIRELDQDLGKANSSWLFIT